MPIGSLKAYQRQRKEILSTFHASPELTGSELARQIKDIHAKTAMVARKEKLAPVKQAMGSASGEVEERRRAIHKDNQDRESQDLQRGTNVKLGGVETAVEEGNEKVARILSRGFLDQTKALKEIARSLAAAGGLLGGKSLLGMAMDGALVRSGKNVPKGGTGAAGAGKGFLSRVGTALEEGGGRLSGLPSAGRRAMGSIEAGAARAGGVAKSVGATMLEGAKGIGGRALDTVRPISAKVMGAIQPGLKQATTFAQPLWEGTKNLAGKAIGGIKGMFPAAAEGAAAGEGGILSGAKNIGKNVLGSVKGAANLGGVLTLGTAAYDEYSLLSDESKTGKEKAVGTAKIGGGSAGAIAGAELGAAIGTAVTPVLGTAVGAVIGGIGGYFVGSELAESAANFLSDTVEKSGLGDSIGRAAAVVMSPFSEDARTALVSDIKGTVGPMVDSATKLVTDSTDFVGKTWTGSIMPALEKTGKFMSDNSGTMLALISPMGALANGILNLDFNKTMEDLQGKFTDLEKGLKDQKDALGAAGSTIWAGVKSAASTVAETGKTAYGTIKSGYEKGATEAGGGIGAIGGGVAGAISAVPTAGTQVAGGARKAYGEISSATANARGIAAGRWSDDEQKVIGQGQAAGEKFRSGQGLDEDTKAKISATATKYGIDPKDMMAIVQMESGGNKNAISATGAAGLGQFTGGTAKQYGMTNRFDPDQNIDATARLYLDNKKALEKQGVEPTLDNIYLAHQQGAGGAAQIIKASKGQGQITDAVAKNMGLNVGGNAGSVQGFIDANSKALAAASTKAQTYTAPSTATQVAAVPTMTAATGMTKPTISTVVPQPIGATAQVEPVRVAQATTAPIPQIQETTPAEVSKVEVTNPAEPAKAPAAPARQQTTSSRPTQTASLSDIPAFFPDVSIMPLLLGRV